MTSEPRDIFAWAWLPGAETPVPVGNVRQATGRVVFHYGRRYLRRPQAISLYEPELPLADEWIEPLPGLEIAGSLADASPDSWGRKVILARLLGSEAPPS